MYVFLFYIVKSNIIMTHIQNTKIIENYYGYKSCKPIKNTLKLLMVKKMICKNLIIIYKFSHTIFYNNLKTNDEIKNIKKSILENKIKIPLLLTISINGVFNIIQEDHIKFLLAIKNISYKEIKKFNIENINIQLLTFPYLNKKEIFNSFIYSKRNY